MPAWFVHNLSYLWFAIFFATCGRSTGKAETYSRLIPMVDTYSAIISIALCHYNCISVVTTLYSSSQQDKESKCLSNTSCSRTVHEVHAVSGLHGHGVEELRASLAAVASDYVAARKPQVQRPPSVPRQQPAKRPGQKTQLRMRPALWCCLGACGPYLSCFCAAAASCSVLLLLRFLRDAAAATCLLAAS